MKKCVLIPWVLMGLFPVLSGCLPGPDPSTTGRRATEDQGPFTVVVTTGMVADLVSHVTGRRAEVRGLMGPGVDPHLFRPTSDDIGQLMQADVVFYSGLLLEGGLQAALERAARSGKPVQAVTDNLSEELLRHPAEFAGHPDPHVWHDAALWARCLDTVVETLSRFDPHHAAQYRKNASRYRAELLELDRLVQDGIRTIPEERRYLVTAHDAFGYFCRAYGLQERSVQGLTTESEPAVQDINALIDFLVERQIPAIFQEETVNIAHIRAVIEGARRRGWTVRIHGPLYSDSLGAAGTEMGTYAGMMRHNVATIIDGLGGTVPDDWDRSPNTITSSSTGGRGGVFEQVRAFPCCPCPCQPRGSAFNRCNAFVAGTGKGNTLSGGASGRRCFTWFRIRPTGVRPSVRPSVRPVCRSAETASAVQASKPVWPVLRHSSEQSRHR